MNMPRLLADRYLILESLGTDADGERFRARDARLDRTVEVFALSAPAGSAAASARLAAARQAATLLHPNIVRIFDVAEEDALAYVVSEAVEGGTLAQSLARGHPYRPEIPTSVARQIATALAAAHGQGLVHGGLTPERVRLTPDGDAYVEGFCLTHPTPGPPWAAPEVIAGAPPTAAADVYALGAMLYALLSGQAPRPGSETLPPGIPGSLRGLTTRLLAEMPSQRPTAAWTADALRRTAEDAARTTGVVTTATAANLPPSTGGPRGADPPAPPLLPTAPAEPQGGGRRWWLIALVVVGLLLAALAIPQILRGPVTPRPAATATPFVAAGATGVPSAFHRIGRVDAIDGARWTVEGQVIHVPFTVSNSPRPGVRATVEGVIHPDGQWVATQLTWEP
ncbi:MAG: serine/threonine protein kinase [Anaerolineae bacterium]|nr:serine/threonine protein kinase [Anaerolineae bacterium]